ncbi:MAG TPA: low molecular weight protein-tyrosine-phosphatase [Pseudogracilibacillus sp.]|nr:low molecular weight protein-tyrosine-phosphatase [Pseudogracilibacillus sp.]
MIRVLFVCLGNICRSPMAEAVFRHRVLEEGLVEKIEVDSAGTALWHSGKPPHEGTRNKLDEVGISYDGMTARQIRQDDFDRFQYVIVMDEDNLSNLRAEYDIPDHVVVKKLLDFLEDNPEKNVPDPYYTGDFQETYELVTAATEALLREIIDKNE